MARPVKYPPHLAALQGQLEKKSRNPTGKELENLDPLVWTPWFAEENSEAPEGAEEDKYWVIFADDTVVTSNSCFWGSAENYGESILLEDRIVGIRPLITEFAPGAYVYVKSDASGLGAGILPPMMALRGENHFITGYRSDVQGEQAVIIDGFYFSVDDVILHTC